MDVQRQLRNTAGMALSVAMLASLGAAAHAQETTVDGLVTGRSGPTLSVKTHDTPRLTVVLSDGTKAVEKGGGFLGLGRHDLAVTELVPGLFVHVEGSFDPDHKLLAKKVTFSRTAFRTAQQIDAGLNPVAEQVASAQDQLRSDRRDIESSQQTLAQHGQDIESTKQGLNATNQATAANGQAIGKANQRFGQLDQYEEKGSLTVNFANGRSTVSPRDKSQLTEFLKSTNDTQGFMVEVQGYASTSGSAALNQRLSSDRANAVLSIVQQSGVPLTRILAPAAMGTTNQVASNHTRKGQAENRRVVVTILVNKGITG